MNAKDREALREARFDLERRLFAVEAFRVPGAVTPSATYWNGFCWGLTIALEALGRIDKKEESK